MNLQHPLARVKGHGASGDGSHHWWLQRLTALALIPLSIWFMFSIVCHLGDDYSAMLQWVSTPYVAVLLVLYFAFMFFHAQLGLQVVIEDYIHHEGWRLGILLLSKAVMLVCGVAAVFAVLSVAL